MLNLLHATSPRTLSAQAFDWLQPSPTAPHQVPADSVVAQREASGGAAARPPASQDSQNVRTFVSQAGFSPGKGASSTATSGAAATQQQGRRLAEVWPPAPCLSSHYRPSETFLRQWVS